MRKIERKVGLEGARQVAHRVNNALIEVNERTPHRRRFAQMFRDFRVFAVESDADEIPLAPPLFEQCPEVSILHFFLTFLIKVQSKLPPGSLLLHYKRVLKM